MSLTNTIAVITGGASGIGKATAEKLASQNATVCICDCDHEGAKRVADSLQGKKLAAYHWKMDVADSHKVADVFARIDCVQ